MKNITLSVRESTLKEVRRVAVERDTSVNGLVRTYLESLADEKQRKARTRRELLMLIRKIDAGVGLVTWKRGDLHAR
ncbi:MAG: CopG family transcriptional regulator [Verrucomicrobia bacterium]|nr:CopG family transcriptional regulator [Verrucomicrobiota bacterium]